MKITAMPLIFSGDFGTRLWPAVAAYLTFTSLLCSWLAQQRVPFTICTLRLAFACFIVRRPYYPRFERP
jgi:hypothetical protein